MYEYGEPWWNDTDWENPDLPPESFVNPTSRDIWEQAGEMGERNANFALQSISVHT
jgi:hypothetical protein